MLLTMAIIGWVLVGVLIAVSIGLLRVIVKRPPRPTIEETNKVIVDLQDLVSVVSSMEYDKMTSRFIKENMNQSHIERLIDTVSKSVFTIAAPTLVKYFEEDTYMLMIAHLVQLTIELMYKNDLEGKRK